MALLGSGFLLCDLSEKALSGITISSCDNNVIITQSNRRVKVYKIGDQKLVHDWSAKTGQLLTCPAIDSVSGTQFSVIINGELQRTWLRDDPSIDKGRKIKLSRSAHRLFAIDDTLITLYADGSLGSSDKLLCEVAEPLKIVWCDSLAVNRMNYIVAVCQKANGKKYCVRTYLINAEISSASVEATNIPRHRGEGCSRSFCLQTEDDRVYLVILDDNGALYRTLITSVDEGTPQNTQVLVSLPVVAAVEGGLAVAAIDSTQLVVVSPANRNDQTLGLGLWDTKFGIFHSWAPLPSAKKSNFIIRCPSGHLILPCADGIYAYPIVAKKATLVSSIGKLIPVVCPDERGVPPAICKTLQMLTQPSETPNYSSFKTAFVALQEWLSQCTIDKKLKVLPAIKGLVQRCISEKQFFPGAELIQLVQMHVITSSSSLQLCATFAAHKEINGLLACLSNIKDASESSLVTALSCFLSLDDSKFAVVELAVSVKSDPDETALCDSPVAVFSPQKAYCINRVLMSEFNSSRLLQALHQLEYSHVLNFIPHLEYLLLTTSVTAPKKQLSNTPSIVQVVDWLSLLIDAHYPQMVLSSDLSTLHSKLNNALQLQRQDIENLNEINKSVSRIVQFKKDSAKKHIGSYCITVLQMR